jgi:hypothetical protein
MASRDYYVDASAGADTNGGTSAGAAIVSGTAGVTDGTAVVDLSGDTPDLSGVSVGDCIRIAGETGGIRSGDIFEITAVDDGADTVTVTPTPGTASGLTWAIGGAWATIQKAANTVRTADTDKVWVKASANYTETVNIALAMGNSTPATFEGYTTATGDGGQFTIDGAGTRANGITDSITSAAYYIFKNMRITDHTSHGTSLSMDACVWKNCKFDNNGADGMLGDDYHRFEECEFSDNTGDGCDVDIAAAFVGCRALRNGGNGMEARTGVMFGCLAYSNAGNGLMFSGSGLSFHVFINCTVDGDAKDTGIGIYCGSAFAGLNIVLNCIAYDCTTGIDTTSGMEEQLISRNNLVNSNTADYANGGATYTGEQTGAPLFTNEATQDYTLQSGSPAKGAGFDESQLEGDSSGMDIGARQRIESGGGSGGLLMPNKRGNKQ